MLNYRIIFARRDRVRERIVNYRCTLMKKTRPAFFFCALCLAVALWPASASAVAVTAEYGPSLELKSRDDAMATAFANAIMADAANALPSPPSQTRQRALRVWLQDHYLDLIQTYTENPPVNAGTPERPVTRLSFDVRVDHAGLNQALREMGFLAPAPVAYTLDAQGLAPNIMTRVSALDQLYGLSRREGAEMTVRLLPGKGQWQGSLSQADVVVRTATEKNLDDVWNKLWAPYFLADTPGQATPGTQPTTGSFTGATAGVPLEGYTLLAVDGWRTAAAVQSFDAALRSLSGQRAAYLSEMIVEANSLRVFWQVRVTDRPAFERAVSGYLKTRGLSYNLIP